jgi:glycosyltransferase involved in cell wall biosynthesis
LFDCDKNAIELISQNVEVSSLFQLKDPGKAPFRLLLVAPAKLRRFCKERRIDVVYSARDLANLIAALALRESSGIRLLWGHRSSAHKFSPRIRVLHPLCRLVQNRVYCQIANSGDGLEFYRSLGLCRGNAVVLPNFVDTGRFSPSQQERALQRKSWGIVENETAVGIVGRVAPMKNHEGFLHVASMLVEHLEKPRFLIIGPSDKKALAWLRERIKHYKLEKQVLLLPPHPMETMSRVYNALDVLCSTSLYGEGFGNVIAEAMACGCPVVATDVGEARRILAGFTTVVQPGDDKKYRNAVLDLLHHKPESLPDRMRERIMVLCEPEKIIRQVVKLGEGKFNSSVDQGSFPPRQ